MLQLLKLRRTKLPFILILLLQNAFAQQTDKGIRFEQGLNWSKILDKAKAENKFIFVDCYASWCGPCKLMDAEVYPDASVGDYMNSHFISLKLQMDKTKEDDSVTKFWSGYADKFAGDYTITAYPSFLYFSPDGKIVHKRVGSGSSTDFISWAKDAENPDKQYYAILKNFQPGKLDTTELLGLAFSLVHTDKKLSAEIAADYLQRTPMNNQFTVDGIRITSALRGDSGMRALSLKRISQFRDEEYKDAGHIALLAIFNKDEDVRQIVESKIASFRPEDFRDKAYLPLFEAYLDDNKIQKLVINYLNSLGDEVIKEKANLNLLVYFYDQAIHLHDRYFNFFLKQPHKADKLMGSKGLSNQIVTLVLDKAISRPLLTNADSLHEEVDWKSLKKDLEDNSNKSCADQVWLMARNSYAAAKLKVAIRAKNQADMLRFGNWETESRVAYKNKYVYKEVYQALKDTINEDNRQKIKDAVSGLSPLNTDAWDVFLYSTSKRDLDAALSWSRLCVEFISFMEGNQPNSLDTYANLLYKLGRKEEALRFEEQAVALAPWFKAIRENLEKMKQGKPTWTTF